MREFHVERLSYPVVTPSAVPDYVGPFREGTAPCATENHVIPAFLEMVFDQPQEGMNRN